MESAKEHGGHRAGYVADHDLAGQDHEAVAPATRRSTMVGK
jgi:hypothetical protein